MGRKFLLLTLILILTTFLSGCFDDDVDPKDTIFQDYSKPRFKIVEETDNSTNTTKKVVDAKYYEPQKEVNTKDYVIGSFYIDNLNKRKINSELKPYIIDIIKKYDLIYVQGIEDREEFIKEINSIKTHSVRFNNVDVNSVFVFSDRVKVLDSKVYDGETNFNKNPFIISVDLDNQTLNFIGFDSDEYDVTQETNKIDDVITWTKNNFGKDKNIFIMGSLNTDFPYYDKNHLSKKFDNVLINQSLHTTTDKNYKYNYDNIIGLELDERVLGVGVDYLKEETDGELELIQAISTNYPVYMFYEYRG